MAFPFADEFLHHWYSALDEEIGIMIRTLPKDRSKLVINLYEARQRSGDADLETLILMQPKDDVIYIAKKTTELDE